MVGSSLDWEFPCKAGDGEKGGRPRKFWPDSFIHHYTIRKPIVRRDTWRIDWLGYWLFCFALFGCTTSNAKQEHSIGATKHLLSYVEASQVPMSTGGIWISDHEVAFNVRKPGVMELTQAQRDEIQEGNDPDYYRWDYTRWSEVWILDIESGKTRKYADGSLRSFKDGVMTVTLRGYKPRRPDPGKPRMEQSYAELLEGRIGEEKPITRPMEPIKFQPDKCPGEPIGSKTRHRYQLRPEHGCLDIRYGESPELPPLYYRRDGKVIELKMLHADIGNVPTNVTNWVEWLGAYLLKSSTGKGSYPTQTVHLMKPDGNLLAMPLNTWGIGSIRPTRAGMQGDYMHVLRPGEDGLYLWRNGEILHIAEGSMREGLWDVSYSPDGCKVSYRSYARRVSSVPGFEDYRLRVIDLCKAFNLPPDTNPFVWPKSTNP